MIRVIGINGATIKARMAMLSLAIALHITIYLPTINQQIQQLNIEYSTFTFIKSYGTIFMVLMLYTFSINTFYRAYRRKKLSIYARITEVTRFFTINACWLAFTFIVGLVLAFISFYTVDTMVSFVSGFIDFVFMLSYPIFLVSSELLFVMGVSIGMVFLLYGLRRRYRKVEEPKYHDVSFSHVG
ncbi:MAG: hypothetical protein FWD52_03430 [Candidatus Bathyarchaeota archaeon]|nr:hypothetical protein [Candidatus Termiticorpusculum sp.]